MRRWLIRSLSFAAACAIGLAVTGAVPPDVTAAEPLPFVVAKDILPAATAEKLQSALAQGLQANLTRGAGAASSARGVFVLDSGAAQRVASLTPAGLVASAPMVLVAHTAFPAVESAEILALLRKTPGAKIAHDGPGSASQRCAAHLRDLLPATLSESHKSPDVSPATSVTSGDVDLACLEAPLAIPLIQAGAVTPVLVAGDERLAAVWDVPTAAEVGLPLFSVTAWFGLYLAGPEAKPEAIGKANLALQGVLADDAVLQALANVGLTPFPLTHRTPDAHAAFQAAEADRRK